jgi:Tol biopolymer transport system component
VAPKRDDESSRGIWTAERLRGDWTKPVLLDSPVNSQPSVGFPCVTNSKTLYFLSMTGPGKGLYRSTPEGGAYRAIEKLDVLPTASEYVFGDFYVSPDESFIVFYSNLPDNFGQGDLYVAFREPDGSWTKPQNLGKKVSTAGYDYAPSISPDGRYLFFTRDVLNHEGDIYWISAEIINDLR